MMTAINEAAIFTLLEDKRAISRGELEALLAKAKAGKGLNELEVAKLLRINDREHLEAIFTIARDLKERIYGKRVVLFAPLYTSNECTNNCLYCGFRHDNQGLARKTLTTAEIITESRLLERMGHKRILLICGEDQTKFAPEQMIAAMEGIYAETGIRRINVEAAPMQVEEYRELKAAGVGTYVLFQETYHQETYRAMHPSGPKANYQNRLTAIDLAIAGGIDDVGIGALLGLYDYRFEVLATMQHVQALEREFGIGPHTISVPRLQAAPDSALREAPYPVSDLDFKKIVAIYRLAVPYTGIILSTREQAQLRDELLNLGVSQISAGSSTSPGGYQEGSCETRAEEEDQQFSISDNRSLPEMLASICEKGYIPSFCTACYRRQRTGEAFMSIAKEGEIYNFCQPNAILTFKENLLDYGNPELLAKGNQIIEKALAEISDLKMKQQTLQRLAAMEKGERDLYF